MKSIGQKIMQVGGLAGTADLSEWESEFIDSIEKKTEGGKNTRGLTEKQVTIIDCLYRRHFA